MLCEVEGALKVKRTVGVLPGAVSRSRDVWDRERSRSTKRGFFQSKISRNPLINPGLY